METGGDVICGFTASQTGCLLTRIGMEGERNGSLHVAAVMTMRRAKWFLMSFPMLWWCVDPQQKVKLWYVVEVFATGGMVTQGSKPT